MQYVCRDVFRWNQTNWKRNFNAVKHNQWILTRYNKIIEFSFNIDLVLIDPNSAWSLFSLKCWTSAWKLSLSNWIAVWVQLKTAPDGTCETRSLHSGTSLFHCQKWQLKCLFTSMQCEAVNSVLSRCLFSVGTHSHPLKIRCRSMFTGSMFVFL